MPSYLTARYPFTEDAERVLIVDASEQAHVAAREADLAPGIVHEPDYGGGGGLPGGYGLYLLPSAKQLTAPSWRRLGELVRAGATVYASYFLVGKSRDDPRVSTHSRPKTAGCVSACTALMRQSFNTQPPEGGRGL